MSTKAEVIASIDAALVVANNLDDQAATIAQLTQERDAAVAERDAANATVAQFKTFRDAVVADAAARKLADAAKVEGQDLLDAASGLPA